MGKKSELQKINVGETITNCIPKEPIVFKEHGLTKLERAFD